MKIVMSICCDKLLMEQVLNKILNIFRIFLLGMLLFRHLVIDTHNFLLFFWGGEGGMSDRFVIFEHF